MAHKSGALKYLGFFLSNITSEVQFKLSTPSVSDTDQRTTADQCLPSLLQVYMQTISVKHKSKTTYMIDELI